MEIISTIGCIITFAVWFIRPPGEKAMCLNKELIFRRRRRQQRQRGQNAKDTNKNEGKINCIEMKWWQNAHYHTLPKFMFIARPRPYPPNDTKLFLCRVHYVFILMMHEHNRSTVPKILVVDSVFLGRNNFVYFIRQTTTTAMTTTTATKSCFMRIRRLSSNSAKVDIHHTMMMTMIKIGFSARQQ